MSFAVRHSLEGDLPAMLAIYERARAYMASLGNPHQRAIRLSLCCERI